MINLQDHDIYGNKFCFEELYRWIDDKVNNNATKMDHTACITFIGSPGIGKTYGIEKICELLKVRIKKIDSTNCKTVKELQELFVKMACINLEDVLRNEVSKKIIFIDEFEIMIQLDRNMPSALYQLIDTTVSGNKSLPYIPVVIACNNNVEKKLGDIKRYCKSIHLRSPTDADVLLMLRMYSQKQKIKVSADVLLRISETVSGNIQQALHLLHYEILQISNKQNQNNENNNETENSNENKTYYKIQNSIDIMPDINILYNNPSRRTAYHLFEEDIWMNPLRFHENLSKEIEMRKGTKTKKDNVYSNILQCILTWDTMINNLDINDNSIDIAMEYLCNAPCYILPQLERKKNVEEATMNEFTKTLSQMSLQCKLNRQTYKDNFPWEHIGNYFYTLKKNIHKKFSLVDTDI